MTQDRLHAETLRGRYLQENSSSAEQGGGGRQSPPTVAQSPLSIAQARLAAKLEASRIRDSGTTDDRKEAPTHHVPPLMLMSQPALPSKQQGSSRLILDRSGDSPIASPRQLSAAGPRRNPQLTMQPTSFPTCNTLTASPDEAPLRRQTCSIIEDDSTRLTSSSPAPRQSLVKPTVSSRSRSPGVARPVPRLGQHPHGARRETTATSAAVAFAKANQLRVQLPTAAKGMQNW